MLKPEPPRELHEGFAYLVVAPPTSDTETRAALPASRAVVHRRSHRSGSVRLTLRITCGPRRARTLPDPVRGDEGRSHLRKVRDRPDRQVHPLVSRRHFLTFRGHAARASQAPSPLIVLPCRHSGKG